MIGSFIQNNKRAVYLMMAYFLLMLIIAFFWPKEIDWRPSYAAEHTKPYGAKVLHSEFSSLFPMASFQTSEAPIYNTVHDSLQFDKQSAYIFINASFSPDSLELSRLYAFVEKGNTVFIAAERFSNALLDTLQVKIEEDYSYSAQRDTSIISFKYQAFSENTFEFPNNGIDRYFEADTLFIGQMISYLEFGNQMNQFVVPFKKGKLILNTNPLGFTNYSILRDETRSYASNALSYLAGVEHIIWDEYYKIGKPGKSSSPLVEILQIPGLRWAYWLSFWTLLLFIGFHSKRKQRIIPIEKPVKNTSLEYVETMGNLYYEQSTHQNIAIKKIEFFQSFLARQYSMSNIKFSEEDIQTLVGKTDKTETELRELFSLIHNISNGGQLDVATLKKLNNQINNFYK